MAQTADATARTAALTTLDELYLHLDREDEPWSVHLEVVVDGRLDPERLRAAVRRAVLRHPIARARLVDPRETDVRYRWEIAEALEEVPLEELEAANVRGVDDARATLLSRSVPLDRPGPFALVLVHAPEGDVLILNLHHAAGDGLSALRLLRSIGAAYADPAGDGDGGLADPLELRDLQALARAGSLRERGGRARAGWDYAARGAVRPARLAPEGGADAPGYGLVRDVVEPDELALVRERRPDGATVNDALLGALATSVQRWNDERDESTGTVWLMMPMNLRPPEWREEVVGNFASYVSVRFDGEDRETLADATRAAARRTRRMKEDGIAGLLVEVAAPPTLLPVGVKRRMPRLIPLAMDAVVDTAVLSNLGRIAEPPDFGEGVGPAREVWFSPPGRMPLGASLGATAVGGRLLLALRHRHAQFDAGAAGHFLRLVHRTLVDG